MFAFQGARIFNTLPKDIRNEEDLEDMLVRFKQKLSLRNRRIARKIEIRRKMKKGTNSLVNQLISKAGYSDRFIQSDFYITPPMNHQAAIIIQMQ